MLRIILPIAAAASFATAAFAQSPNRDSRRPAKPKQ
jgi:hypothetical protein